MEIDRLGIQRPRKEMNVVLQVRSRRKTDSGKYGGLFLGCSSYATGKLDRSDQLRVHSAIFQYSEHCSNLRYIRRRPESVAGPILSQSGRGVNSYIMSKITRT